MTDCSCYAQKQLLLSARPSHRTSVRLSLCPFVRHTGGSVKNEIFTKSSPLHDPSRRNQPCRILSQSDQRF